MEPWAAVVTGLIAGWLYIWGSSFLVRLRIDDAVDAIPVHMINGIWGMLAVGLFASPRKLDLAYGVSEHAGWFYSLGNGSANARLLAAQACAVLFISGWTMITMFPFFMWLNYKGWFRADSLEELVGLDISYHGGMNAKDGGVKKEYVEAYNRHKGNIRNRKSTRANAGSTVHGDSEHDPEMDQEAAAREAYAEDLSVQN